jgi:hypothetical protein
MAVELKACKDYEVSVEFTGNVSYDTYNELSLGLPRDVGGVLRLRNASQAGNPSFAEAALLQVVTTSPVCDASAILDLGGSKSVIPTPASDFGTFVVPQSTERLCSVGLYVGGTAGSKVTARVYASTGLTRDYLISEGSAVLSQTFLNYVDVPISALLVAGYQWATSDAGRPARVLRGELNRHDSSPRERHVQRPSKVRPGGVGPEVGSQHRPRLHR